MKVVLFTGRRRTGSYQIRGEQIAQALGGRAMLGIDAYECRKADVVVVIKRALAATVRAIRESGALFVLDIVDAYPQPGCSLWTEDESKKWLKDYIAHLKPDFVIWPNARMQEDGGGGGAVIYHHHRPEIRVNPIRERILRIGYEGDERFLASWWQTIQAECRARRAEFVVNPQHVADVDVVLALRGKGWNGYPQQHWKSQVKLANAHGSGTPFIGAPECGYIETACGAEHWASTPGELSIALDALESQAARQKVQDRFLEHAFTVEAAAARYREVLCALKS